MTVPNWLPHNVRLAEFGDVLTYGEVLELLTVQEGRQPLYPVPTQTSLAVGEEMTYRLDVPSYSNILKGASTCGPRLLFDECEVAEPLANDEDVKYLPVPLGNDLFVPKPFEYVLPDDPDRYFPWLSQFQDNMRRAN